MVSDDELMIAYEDTNINVMKMLGYAPEIEEWACMVEQVVAEMQVGKFSW